MGSINRLSKLIPNAASLPDKLRPFLKEENEKKKIKNIRLPVKTFDWNRKHSVVFEEIKKAVAKIALLNDFIPSRETRVKCDASHSGLEATLDQWSDQNEWVPIAFAFRYLNTQEKKYSTNELELLAVVWAVDRFEHYLLGKEFVIATDHKALTSAFGEHRSNKTYQSRLIRWVDRLLLYQFKVIYILGMVMGIVDYLSREPNGKPCPESEINERFVVTSIEDFHKALDCLSSRLSDTDRKIDVIILEYSGTRSEISHCKDNSSHGWYGDQFVQNWTKLDRNENGQSSRFQREQNEKNTLNKISRTKQSDKNSDSVRKNCNKSIKQSAITRKMDQSQSGSDKSKKIVKIANRQNEVRDQLTEQVTETIFSRTRMVKRGACSRPDSDTSDSEIQQIEWRTVKRYIKPKGQ